MLWKRHKSKTFAPEKLHKPLTGLENYRDLCRVCMSSYTCIYMHSGVIMFLCMSISNVCVCASFCSHPVFFSRCKKKNKKRKKDVWVIASWCRISLIWASLMKSKCGETDREEPHGNSLRQCPPGFHGNPGSARIGGYITFFSNEANRLISSIYLCVPSGSSRPSACLLSHRGRCGGGGYDCSSRIYFVQCWEAKLLLCALMWDSQDKCEEDCLL